MTAAVAWRASKHAANRDVDPVPRHRKRQRVCVGREGAGAGQSCGAVVACAALVGAAIVGGGAERGAVPSSAVTVLQAGGATVA